MHICCCHKRHLKLKPHPVKPQYPKLTMDTSKHTFLKLFWLDEGQSSELRHQFQHFEGKKRKKEKSRNKKTKTDILVWNSKGNRKDMKCYQACCPTCDIHSAKYFFTPFKAGYYSSFFTITVISRQPLLYTLWIVTVASNLKCIYFARFLSLMCFAPSSSLLKAL